MKKTQHQRVAYRNGKFVGFGDVTAAIDEVMMLACNSACRRFCKIINYFQKHGHVMFHRDDSTSDYEVVTAMQEWAAETGNWFFQDAGTHVFCIVAEKSEPCKRRI